MTLRYLYNKKRGLVYVFFANSLSAKLSNIRLTRIPTVIKRFGVKRYKKKLVLFSRKNQDITLITRETNIRRNLRKYYRYYPYRIIKVYFLLLYLLGFIFLSFYY
jgi:hypothetical protein